MTIQFSCNCGKQLQAQDEHAGKLTVCPSCQRELTIPALDQAVLSVLPEDAPSPAPAVPRRRDSRPAWDDAEREPLAAGPSRTSGKATASLILGILSFVLPLIPAVLAIIFGSMGLKEIKRSRGRLKGSGLAVGGIVTGIIGLVIMLPLVGLSLLLPAVSKVREAANRSHSATNLKQIGLAMHHYHDNHGHLPPAVVYSRDGRPLYSWRVLLLPYLEQDNLYNSFNTEEPWDSPNNRKFLDLMPKVYETPGRDSPKGHTLFKVFDGPGSVFDSRKALQLGQARLMESGEAPLLRNITDGHANTFLVVEAGEAVPWTKPVDLPYLPNGSLPNLESPYSAGFQAVFVDGSVRTIPKKTSDNVLRAYITPRGGEPSSSYDLP